MGQLDVRDFLYLGPEILLTTLALALLLWGAIANVERQARQCAWLALLSLGATAFYVAWLQTTLEVPPACWRRPSCSTASRSCGRSWCWGR